MCLDVQQKTIWNLIQIEIDFLKAFSWLICHLEYILASAEVSVIGLNKLSYKVNIPDVPKNHIQHIPPAVSRPRGSLWRGALGTGVLGCLQAAYFGF